MNITREDLPGRQVALTIELPTDTINEALDKAYRQMVNQVAVPGFRRGKAPRYILESFVGKEALTERAVRNILPQAVQDAIDDQKIEALDVGDVEIVSMDPVQVKVIVVQPPIIELGDYAPIRVDREEINIGPEQVDEVVSELRREGSPWNEPEEPRPLRDGDMVYLNLEGFTTEGELQEAKRENFPTIVGMTRAGVPEVVNQALAGVSVGEEKDVTDTLPDDYPNEALRGKDVTYHVTVLSMKEQQLPELDEEFAKKFGFDSIELLRESIEKNLRDRAEQTTKSAQVEKVIDQIVERSTVEVPDVMVKEELDGMLQRLEGRLREQKLALRQYFNYSGISEEEWREANREQARDRVVRTLVLQEFARREGLSVDEGEIDTEISELLNSVEGAEREQAEAILGRHETRHDIEDRIFQRKLVERMIAIAEGTQEAAPAPEGSGGAAGEDSDEEATADATALEDAGGAAEVLGTGDVSTRSPNETGNASGGGTPSTAPALEDAEKS